MRMRCIGGPCHGVIMDVDPHERDAWPFEFAEPSPTVMDLMHAGPECTVRATRHQYTKRQVRNGDEVVFYLAPADWSDIDALRLALEP